VRPDYNPKENDMPCVTKYQATTPSSRREWLDEIYYALKSGKWNVDFLYSLVNWEFYNNRLYIEEVQQFMGWLSPSQRKALRHIAIRDGYTMFSLDENPYKKLQALQFITEFATNKKELQQKSLELKATMAEAPDGFTVSDALDKAYELTFELASEFGLEFVVDVEKRVEMFCKPEE
jgi:hypothetical protein